MCTLLCFLLLAINVPFFIWYWTGKHTAGARLGDLRDQQCDSTLVEGIDGEPEQLSITFPSQVWIFTTWEEIPHFAVMLFLLFDDTDPEGTLLRLSPK